MDKKETFIINEKLKARKEMLRIRRENKKTENHETAPGHPQKMEAR